MPTVLPPAAGRPVTVVGIGADGWAGLAEPVRALVGAARLVIGADRQLSLLPDGAGGERRPWPSPLLPAVAAWRDDLLSGGVVVLASGDPLLSGIGGTLVRELGAEQVHVVPAVSSVALARARMGWAAEPDDWLSLVGRDLDRLRRELAPGRRLVLLSADGGSPDRVAELLVDAGYGGSVLTVWEELGAAAETGRQGTAAEWTGQQAGPLNLLCLECRADPGVALPGRAPGLPDEAYRHDGQLTKRDLRASALSRLSPLPGDLLWDVGAGAGSVAVEWARSDPRCRAVAIEADPARAARIGDNARRLGVPGVRVVTGRAPEALAGLPVPDAVFVGGGATAPGLLETCWAAVRVGGRLVAHAVTLESEQLLVDRSRAWGGELTRIAVERAGPLGGLTGWQPARAVVQYSVRKPHPSGEPS
ncbi:precorrin-6y C5,15-methyltransferase (decarboxylating) subunit CbiE [Nakamurella endophytica]|uniref:Precorrin-6Y C5,15-methyltransferase n=1 Tax=Nakamurella endophytica TaxID=1748367 RepID=A0A917SJM5_9ACTN|nr:precorrin-6y C5,15-methyltransferase (decarboxylating) subunit CbiE [Nakamurella endophytica]GGL85237.1 precorrin-6Y C5,15-methyltransferase [Nakamurella endophytica]